ncbi:hypothetical protein [Salinibaculum salinum]|uniref:hypothetical protein n=1 Tax=Salinibaculum salinum TaxID=3131996 RepID=UPI0030EB4CA9
MTKRAVWRTYQEFLDRMTDEMLDIVAEEFGGGLLGKAAKSGAKRVTKDIQDDMRQQGRLVVEYADSLADGQDDTAYEDRFLRTNPVYQRYDGDREAELRDHLLSHFRQVGSDLAPLVASAEDDFWTALRTEYTRSEAESIVDRHFSQAETFEEYKDGVFSSQRIGGKVLYVLEKGETRLRESIYLDLTDVYSETDTS